MMTKPDPGEVRLGFLNPLNAPWLFEAADAPPQSFDRDEVRSLAAASALLGELGEVVFQLRDRLCALSKPTTKLPIESKRLLAATYLELVITMLAARDEVLARDEPGAVASLASLSLEDLHAIGERAVLASESTNAWEFRAGLNGLTLLSRWAELTGDPDAIHLARDAMAASKQSMAAVRSALGCILNEAAPSAKSALPLAIAAYDLLIWDRTANTGLETISAENRRKRAPPWLIDMPLPGGALAEPRAVIDALLTRLGAAGSTTLTRFSSGGARSAQVLLTALLQIRNREFQRSRLLAPQPTFPGNPSWLSLLQILGAVRESHAIEGLLNEGASANELTAGWRSVGWWSARANPRSPGDKSASNKPPLLVVVGNRPIRGTAT
jgi:hypothetical protein